MEEYFHIFTNGLSESLLYRDESDYICGMNDVPICLLMTRAKLLCFCLMSNHVHFVLHATEADCRKFIMEFKRRTGQRLKEKYADIHSINDVAEEIKKIDVNKYLKIAIGYVLRNPMVTRGSHYLPTTYRWSSGGIYFNDITDKSNFRKFSELKITEIRERFRTRMKLPDDYLLDRDGVIFPGSYIDSNEVEKIFYMRPSIFIYYLSKDNDAKFEASQHKNDPVARDDLNLESLQLQICRDEYGDVPFEMLSMEEKVEIGEKLWKRHRVPAAQYARVFSVPLRALENYTWAQNSMLGSKKPDSH